MKRNSLGWWLAASNVAIVLLVAAGISYFAIDMLRDLADGQQKIRVQLAGANSRAEITRMAEDTLTYARVLAERPPMRRLISESGREGLKPFLRRFCETSELDACAVFDGAQVVAASGVELPWPQLYTVAVEQGERFMAVPPGTEYSVVGAVAKLPAQYSSFSVVVVRLLGAELANVLSEHTGLPVRIVNYRAFNATPVNEFTSLHSQALADGRFAVQRIDSLGLYASSYPIFSSSGEGIALIETRASSTETDQAVSSLVSRLILTAVVFALLAVVAGVLLGWRVTKPTEALTDAAVRLGQGDFATSIPTAGPAEIGQLARTMDDMRRNLVDLNSELRHREAEAQVVLEAVVEGVYAVDQERNIRYLNPQAARLLGIEAGEAIGKFCGDVLKPCGPPGSPSGTRPCATTACPILRARQSGSAQSVEQLQTRAGNRQTVITSSRVVDGLQVQVMRDETELEGVRRARDTVLANVSHEFRTPLAAQLASIELLREGLKTSPPEQLEDLVLSLERGTHAADAPHRQPARERAHRVRSARRAPPEHRDQGRGRRRAWRWSRRCCASVASRSKWTCPTASSCRATPRVSRRCSSTSSPMPASLRPRVRRSASARASMASSVSAWVEDSGPGLPEGDTVGIFERFKRGGAQEPEPGGLGLGLWISRSIVERHGGSIAAARSADGFTRFTLTLPIEPQGSER